MYLLIVLCAVFHIGKGASPFIINSLENAVTIADFQPQQVHLSIGGKLFILCVCVCVCVYVCMYMSGLGSIMN